MSKRDVEADILGRLDAFVAGGGKLPGTNDGKVNIVGLCRELGLPASDAQHMHRKDAIKAAVSALAEEQGLLPVGARAQTEEDKAVQARIARVASQAKDDAQAAVEQAAAASVLMEELRSARDLIAKLTLERDALAARLRLVEESGVLPRT